VRTYTTSVSSPSFHGDGEPAEVGIRQEPDLLAGKFKHRAILVGEDDRTDTTADRESCARRAIDAGHVGRAADIAHAAAQHALRSAEDQAIVEAADRKRIMLAAESQCAMAARSADDPTGFVDRQHDAAAFGLRLAETGAEQDHQRNENAPE